MKFRLVIAIIIGALISSALLVADAITDSGLVVLELLWPGISAAYLFWGAIGGSASMGIAVAWFVNTLVYAVPAFAAVMLVKLPLRAT